MIAINDLSKMIIGVSGKDVSQISARGRNSDKALIQEKLGWKPSLESGIRKTYNWLESQLSK